MQDSFEQLIPASQAALDRSTPTARFIAADIMDKRNFNPIARMIDLAEELESADVELGTPVHAEKRMKLYNALAKYYAPQPKSVDINLTKTERFTIEAVSFAELMEDRMDKIPQQSQYTGPTLLGSREVVDVEVEDG